MWTTTFVNRNTITCNFKFENLLLWSITALSILFRLICCSRRSYAFCLSLEKWLVLPTCTHYAMPQWWWTSERNDDGQCWCKEGQAGPRLVASPYFVAVRGVENSVCDQAWWQCQLYSAKLFWCICLTLVWKHCKPNRVTVLTNSSHPNYFSAYIFN